MFGVTKDWIVILSFVLFFIGAIIAEVLWLVRNDWASPGRSIAYVMITDFFSFCVASFVAFVLFGIMFAMVMGPSGTGGSGNEIAMWIGLIFAIVFPPSLLVLSKRLMLMLLKIKSGTAAWAYSLASSVLILLTTLIPPTLIFYLL